MARRTSTGEPDGFITFVTVSVGNGAGLGALACAEIAAQEQQDWPFSRGRAFRLTKNCTVRARRKGMKIHRRMLVGRRAPVLTKMLLVIATARIQHRQPKIFRVL